MENKRLLNLNKILICSCMFMLIFGLFLFVDKGTQSVEVAAGTDSLTVDCPNTVVGGGEIVCSVKINSVTMFAQGISSNFKASKGLTFDSFELDGAWKDYGISADGIVIVTKSNEGVSGNSTLGTLKYKVPSDAPSNTVYKIELVNVEIGDGDVNTVTFDSVYDEVRVVSSINTLNNISLSSGTIKESFDKNKKEYSADVNSDKVTINVTKTDNNSVVSGDVGEVNLHYGTNVFNIDVTSESGVKNTYKISIYRKYEFSSDKYVYNKDDNYLYTYNDVDNSVILDKIVLKDNLSKKIENNKLIISYSNEKLVEIKILNINVKEYNVANKEISLYSGVILSELVNNITLSNGLSYKVYNGNNLVGTNNELLDGMKFKIYYNNKEIDSYNIKVAPFSLTFDKSLNVDNNNKYINYLNANSKFSYLLEKINIAGGKIKLVDLNNKEKSSGSILATGDKLIIYKGEKKEIEYILSVFGDVNSDGEVGLVDLVKMRRFLTNNSNDIKGVYFNALDLDKNGKIELVDLVRIRKIIARVDVDE